MPLQGEYEPSTAEWVNKQVTEYEGSGGTEGTLLRGVPTVIVTMVGASTGKLRKHPVMRVEHDGTYAAVASKGGAPKNPTWVGNLRKNPLVEVQDGTAHGDYHAREATPTSTRSGGRGRSRCGPTTSPTRPRPTGRSRSSCSNRRHS